MLSYKFFPYLLFSGGKARILYLFFLVFTLIISNSERFGDRVDERVPHAGAGGEHELRRVRHGQPPGQPAQTGLRQGLWAPQSKVRGFYSNAKIFFSLQNCTKDLCVSSFSFFQLQRKCKNTFVNNLSLILHLTPGSKLIMPKLIAQRYNVVPSTSVPLRVIIKLSECDKCPHRWPVSSHRWPRPY